jgi:hypothetical protein
VGYAQRPLQVLGVGYHLPFANMLLPEAISDARPLVKAQLPRVGSGLVVHGRFSDDDPLFHELAEEDLLPPEDEPFEADLTQDTAGEGSPLSEPVPPVVRLLAKVLAPLSSSLHALSQYGEAYAPAVRVLVSFDAPDKADTRVQHVRDALQIAGLPALDCEAVLAADSLLVADAWLDAGEKRPLLAIAAEWHDAPPEGSTEGGVAVLLGPGVFELPEPVQILATLHRPVAGDVGALTDVLANAVLWGKADAPSVNPAWISGFDAGHDTLLSHALSQASLSGVAAQSAQRRPDRIVGHAGTAGGWLSIAAAVESGIASPHLILHHAKTAQAAILYVNSASSHDHSNR